MEEKPKDVSEIDFFTRQIMEGDGFAFMWVYKPLCPECGEARLKKLKRENRKTIKCFLQGETASLAAADLQKIIDGIAEKTGIAIKSVKVMDSAREEGLTSIPLQIMFTSDLTMFEKFIEKIENNRKLLTIPALKIRVKNKRKPMGISVTMTISGFVQKEETEE